MQVFDECTKRGDYRRLDDVFDVTNLDVERSNSEDLYKAQQKNRGQVAYSTSECADMKTIHPSKRLKTSSPATMSASSSGKCRSLRLNHNQKIPKIRATSLMMVKPQKKDTTNLCLP